MLDADPRAMQRLAEGEDLALNELMSRWQGRLMSFLWHMTHDEATARELTQETFVRLYLNRHRYQPKASFDSYIFRIARNLLANHSRWVQRHAAQSLQELMACGFEVPALGRSPDEVLADAETAKTVRRAIATLPADLRESLVLFTYQSFGYREIAEVAGCSEKAVETRIRRARQLLKDQLEHLLPK